MKICIYGAGSIGCYIGGRLAAVGADVSFITRPRVYEELRTSGLKLTDYTGKTIKIAAKDLQLSVDPKIVTDADIIFVCVNRLRLSKLPRNFITTWAHTDPIL